MTEQFWEIRYHDSQPTLTWYSLDRSWMFAGDLDCKGEIHEFGRCLMRFAYDTPQGVIYRLTYGIPKL